jgi:hypothetical protein
MTQQINKRFLTTQTPETKLTNIKPTKTQTQQRSRTYFKQNSSLSLSPILKGEEFKSKLNQFNNNF